MPAAPAADLEVMVDGRCLLVRSLRPDDAVGVDALLRASAEWFERLTGRPAPGAAMPGDVQSLFYALPEGATFDDKHLLVVEDRHAIIGLVDVVVHHPGPSDCAVGLFLVNPDDRGFGVGTAVAASLLGRLRAAGFTRVTATSAAGWRSGLRFLDALGFAVEALPAADADHVTAELKLEPS
jgi:GNAT superfamily N-acetyltransferase